VLGLAIGMRITYAPLVAPFGVALIFSSQWSQSKVRFLVSFSTGLLLGLAGLLCSFALAPEQAFFGNLGFARVNLAYRLANGHVTTLPGSLHDLYKRVIGQDFALIATGVLPGMLALLARRGSDRRLGRELRFLLLLLPFVLIGALAPSPLFQQYFYPFVPFAILTTLYALASLPAGAKWGPWVLGVAAVGVTISTVAGLSRYKMIRELGAVREWEVMRIHARGEELRALVPHGPVLTLAPIYPLEGGLSIYPAWSTGPFAWRTSPQLAADKAARLGIVTPATLVAVLEANPPAAILAGVEDSGEEDLIQYAKTHGYRMRALTEGATLWLAETGR